MKYYREFYIYLQIDKSYSKNTIETYLTNLKIFSDYCEKKELEIDEVDYIDLTIFLEYLKNEKKYSSKSLGNVIASLKSYYRFLLVDHYIDYNPANLLKVPKIEKKYPEYLTIDEINDMLDSINKSSKTGKRDYLLLMLLYDTGVRVSELLNIKINNIDFGSRMIRIVGKGDKERMVYFTEYTLNLLNEYVQSIHNKFEIKNNYLFSKNNGNIITRMEVYNIVNKYCKQASITKKVSPHTIRHSFATHMIQNNADIMSVKTILGHNKVSTTELYTHLNKDDLKKKYDAIMERKE